MRSVILGFATIAAVAASAPALAEATPACPQAVAPTGELAPWSAPVAVVSASSSARAGDARLRVGQAADLALRPVAAVRFPAVPGMPGGNGGLAVVEIAEAGTYRVALGGPGWIDLVAGGKALVSTAHGHGAPCSGIRKIVDFALKPGRYVVAISASPDARARVLVARGR